MSDGAWLRVRLTDSAGHLPTAEYAIVPAAVGFRIARRRNRGGCEGRETDRSLLSWHLTRGSAERRLLQLVGDAVIESPRYQVSVTA